MRPGREEGGKKEGCHPVKILQSQANAAITLPLTVLQQLNRQICSGCIQNMSADLSHGVGCPQNVINGEQRH